MELEKYKQKMKDRRDLGKLATFAGNKNIPIYNWFYYKEAFSRDLVVKALEYFSVEQGTVLDPFCGVGTTLLVCREMGLNSVGFDVLPISVLSSTVKTTDYDSGELRKTAKELLKIEFREVEFNYPHWLERFFHPDVLKDVALFHREVDKIEGPLRNFFLLAFIRTVVETSFSYKDGAVLKYRKRKMKPFRPTFRSRVYRMVGDWEKFSGKLEMETSTLTGFGDARRLPVKGRSMDTVITSPPYLTQEDYKKAYSIENYFIRKKAGEEIFMDSTKEKRKPGDLGLDLPEETLSYFSGIKSFLEEMHRVLKERGKMALVVGNAYIDREIESDFIISHLAEETGFQVENIFVLNQRPALKKRTRKVGSVRESLIQLKKV